MKSKDSAVSRAKILNVAERIFSEKGFDGARVDDIARQAGVNKALIYYYFKGKEDILDQLFTSAMQDIIRLMEHSYEDFELSDEEMVQMFDLMVDLVSKKKRIIKVVLMESLKESTNRLFLFKIADYFMSSEIETVTKAFEKHGIEAKPEAASLDRKQMVVTEFFTSIMPLFNYVVYEEQLRRELKMTQEELRKKFFAAFKATHMAYHLAFLENKPG